MYVILKIGQQIGYATKDSIKYRLEHYPNVLEAVLWTLNDPKGAVAYKAMLDTANTTFPEYIVRYNIYHIN